MKVVINKCYGGFSLSTKAVELCLSRGMTCTTYTPKGECINPHADFVKGVSVLRSVGETYYAKRDSDKAFRTNPVVVGVVLELGEDANGDHAKLRIIDIPFDTLEGWGITDYDGIERIEEHHSTWG